MKSAKSSSTALQRNFIFNANSGNTSPESKNTTITFNASVKPKSKTSGIALNKNMSDCYSKINQVRSKLLTITNNDISKRKKFFECQNELQSSICFHQEFDVTSMDISMNSPVVGRHSSHESELYMDYSTTLDYKAFHCSPQVLGSSDRKPSSKNLIYQLFILKRETKIIHKDSGVNAKRPFANRLSTIASDIKASAIGSSDIIDDLQLLSQMIQGKGTESHVKRESSSFANPTVKFHSDNNLKKNCFRDINKVRLSGKIIKSSQTLNTDVSAKMASPSNNEEWRTKEKTHRTSNILILIPCGTNHDSNA